MLFDTFKGRLNALGIQFPDSNIDFDDRLAALGVIWPSAAVAVEPVSPPIASPLPGTYQDAVTVTLLAESGATIRYTTDGSNPVTSPTAVTYITAFLRTSTTTIRAYAFKGTTQSAIADFAYTVTQAPPPAPNPPSASPIPGSYADTVTIALNATSQDTIKYTIDGSDPKTSVTVLTYTTPFARTITTTVRAYVQRGTAQSATADFVYVVTATPPNPPTASPIPGSYLNTVTVALSATPGDVIRYTLDGTDPKLSGTVITYSAALIITVNTTVRAYALRGTVGSANTSFAYVITAAPPPLPSAPAASFPSGTYTTPINVTLMAQQGGDVIKCTLDGSDPKTSGTVITYTTSIAVATNTTLKAYVVRGGADSATAEFVYVIEIPPPSPPVSSPFPGVYQSTVTVALAAQQDDLIKYTINGGDPVLSGITYTAPITLTSDAVIRVYAIRGDEVSAIAAYSYIILPEPIGELTIDLPRDHPRALIIPYVDRALKITHNLE